MEGDMLSIKLFGSGQLSYHDQYLIGFPNLQPHQLFCYLLLNRTHPHQRDLLATIFWENYPTRIARKYLRNSLWRLHKNFTAIGAPFEEYFFVSEKSISFNCSSKYSLDVERFEHFLDNNKEYSDSELVEEQTKVLESAVALYSGDLLEPLYEDWLYYDRERLRISYLNALSKLVTYYGLTGDYEQGLRYGRQILTIENTREKVHQQMIWLYGLAGDRQSAIKQYQLCCQILREELGVRPMHETRTLYKQIMEEEFDPRKLRYGRESNLVGKNVNTKITEPVGRHALRKLHNLQEMIDQTSQELRQLEGLVIKAINQSE